MLLKCSKEGVALGSRRRWHLEGDCGLEKRPPNGGLWVGKSSLGRGGSQALANPGYGGMWGAEQQETWTCTPGLGNWLAITWASNLALWAPGEGARGNREKKTTGRKTHTNLFVNTLPLGEEEKRLEGWPLGARWQAGTSLFCASPEASELKPRTQELALLLSTLPRRGGKVATNTQS